MTRTFSVFGGGAAAERWRRDGAERVALAKAAATSEWKRCDWRIDRWRDRRSQRVGAAVDSREILAKFGDRAGICDGAGSVWQMDLLRRAASGDFSEIVGEIVPTYDLENRTVGMRQAAEARWRILRRKFAGCCRLMRGE
jgi:Penicillin amidase